MLTRDGAGVARARLAARRAVPGLPFAETDEIAMALELAVREVPGWQQILQAQLERTQNPDRKARFAFVMPALSADPPVREQAFDALPLARESSSRAVGARVAACTQSSAARGGRGAVHHVPALDLLARDSAHR